MKKAIPFRRFLLAFCAVAVFVLAVSSGFLGCGKKAPPLPPHSNPLPPVNDLSYDLKDSKVELMWSVPDKVKQGVFGEGEVVISRAMVSLTDELCPDCPQVFQRIAILPILQVDGEPKPIYEEEVKQGFRYTYKVVLNMESGRSSEASNLVSFDY